jgi:outer membrane protein insertion porin family
MTPMAIVLAAFVLAGLQEPSLPYLPADVCGMHLAAPDTLPPSGSGPVLLAIVLCFDRQGGQSLIDPQTYLAYIQTRPSQPSRSAWISYDETVKDVARADFRRLWNSGFMDDLSIEAVDYRLANGVTGKVLVFNIEERERVRIIEYGGASTVSHSAIDDELKKRNLTVRVDSFVDAAQIRKIAGVVRELYAAKGYQYADVKPATAPVEGAAKRVDVIFTISEGPKVAIRDVQFLGNHAFTDDELGSALKNNRAQNVFSLISDRGTFNEDKYADDAERLTEYYRDHGYIAAQVGQPQLRALDDSDDRRTRWIQLRIPVTEGRQYRVGRIDVAGNTVVTAPALRSLIRLKEGDIYSQERMKKSLEAMREVYGSGGYSDFTAYPDLVPREGTGTVDVTVRVDEGKQYFVNRITISGNTQTHDEVVRRELLLVEAGIFNTEALKASVRRLNQLGYFKPIEAAALEVEKTPGRDDRVDVHLKVEEQNRNQVSFGAGFSEYDGFFGNASFTTTNFLGRGESLTLSGQQGSRGDSYSAAFTEPYVFNRAISLGASVYSRKTDYYLYSDSVDYSEVRTGFSPTVGFPVRRYSRLLLTYGYEVADSASSDAFREAYDGTGSNGVLLFTDGRYTQSSVTPSLVYNTVDQPQFPRRGMRLSGSLQYAGGLLGGTTHFMRTEAEAIRYVPVTRWTALGLRANAGVIRNYGRGDLPYYLRYFLGGEYQIRGVDIRTVGPLNENNAALGGTKFVLFNAEYYYDPFPMVRALLFHDAGQAFSDQQPIDLRQLRTSTGAELRVVVPMLNVPFRLIYAWNIYRDSFQPARGFKFAVGTTF